MVLMSGSFSGSGSSSGFGGGGFRFDKNPTASPPKTSGTGGWAPPLQGGGGGVAGTIPWLPPAPQQAPYVPPVYQAPYQAPQGGYAQGNYGMQPSYGGGGGGGGGGGQAAPAPAPAPRLTSEDFAAKYKGNDNGLAQVDSTFQDQSSMFANVLKKYLEDYTRQYGDGKDQFSGSLGRDAKTAQDGIARNKENGLTSQAEDFFARGVGNSGMFAQEQDKARDQFDRQKTNVSDSLRDSRADLDFRKAKFEGENGANGSNLQAARREAYNRLALKQGLV